METVKIENPNVASLPKHRKGISAALVIVVCLIVAHLFFYYVCGNPSNFDAKGHPIDNNIFGTLYQGGFVIPIVITLLLTVLALGVERIVALHKASGKGKVADFVIQAKELLRKGDLKATEELCDRQQGSVANILKSALVRYRDVENRNDLTSDEKASIVEKEIADTTALELPYMQQNLNVIATISSLGTLRTAGHGARYDPFVRRHGQRGRSRFDRTVARHFGGPDEYRHGYHDRCAGNHRLQLFLLARRKHHQCRRRGRLRDRTDFQRAVRIFKSADNGKS
jgi:hypothetical protein